MQQYELVASKANNQHEADVQSVIKINYDTQDDLVTLKNSPCAGHLDLCSCTKSRYSLKKLFDTTSPTSNNNYNSTSTTHPNNSSNASGTSSSYPSSSSILKTRNTEQDKDVLRERFKKFTETHKQNFWFLDSTKAQATRDGTDPISVEEKVMDFALKCHFYHPTQSLILDVTDKNWNKVFTEAELNDIKKEGSPLECDVPEELKPYYLGLNGMETSAGVFKYARTIEINDPSTERMKVWFSTELEYIAQLFLETGSFNITDMPETDQQYLAFGFLSTIFLGSDVVARGSEVSSESNADAINSSRQLSSIDPIRNRKMSSREDIIFKYGSQELGCSEFGAARDQTKAFRDFDQDAFSLARHVAFGHNNWASRFYQVAKDLEATLILPALAVHLTSPLGMIYSSNWKPVKKALTKRAVVPGAYTPLILTPSASLQSTSDSERAKKINLEDKKRIAVVYDRMVESKMWRLESGKYVEKEMKVVALEQEYEHPAHSVILDPTDPIWEKRFNSEELKELRVFNQPTSNPSSLRFGSFSGSRRKGGFPPPFDPQKALRAWKIIPELPPHLEQFVESFEEKSTLDELYYHVRSFRFHPFNESELHWMQITVEEALMLIYHGYFLKNRTEADLIRRAWGFMDSCFDSSRDITSNSGEKASRATSEAQNQNRSVGGVNNTTRKKVGTKVDQLFAAPLFELGPMEAGAEVIAAAVKSSRNFI
ncbi:hypothetical protein BDC45DRAFT_568367 [Circinella umbellata]|nr:hypothetical protein BDC45DRAFT_568367 [Circinella umbellata]